MRIGILGIAGVLAAAMVARVGLAEQTPVSYARQIKPLLEKRCEDCHSGDEPKGQFDVTSVENLKNHGKKAGPGVIPGKPDQSAILQYITAAKKPRMPKGKDSLPAAEVELIRSWIAQGAPDDSATVIASADEERPEKKNETPDAPPPVFTGDENWDPGLDWNASEVVAVRRYLRLKKLPPATRPVMVQSAGPNPIDNFVWEKWISSGIKPSTQLCDDATFLRRAYLDLIGVIPPAEDAKKFVADKKKDKREKLIDALLKRTDDYAANWAPFWEDALCSNGQHQGGVGTHGNYRKWVFDNFASNKPYDLMVQELLDPTMPNHPERYVLNDDHTRVLQSAADVAQVFLGTAIKCASCHNHFLNEEWPQARAAAFAGYFTDKDLELVRCERKTGQFAKTHFMFDLPAAPQDAPKNEKQRLKRVAELITDPTNPRFSKTIVNRLWKRYIGLGLFEPADDYRLDTPAANAELLDWLADDFVRHGYNIRRTVRMILTSRTYQLKYDPALEDHFDTAKPTEPRWYRSPSLRRLTEEQLLDSIAVAVNQKVLPLEKRAYNSDESTPLTRSLGRPATRNEVSTARPEDSAIVQSLELLNGQEYHDRIYKGDLIAAMSIEPDAAKVVDQAYWAVYGRAPTEKEKAVGVEFLTTSPKPDANAPVEVVWLDDELPAAATPQKDKWQFYSASEKKPFSGKKTHGQSGQSDATGDSAMQHAVTGLNLKAGPKDTLFAYVYLDPARPPKEIMLQWHSGKAWNHRAYWGEDLIPFEPRTKIGDLPKPGQWVRLEVPAEKLGIKSPTLKIDGLSFDQFGGIVYWDKSGIKTGPPVWNPDSIGDLFWALITSPAFAYIN